MAKNNTITYINLKDMCKNQHIFTATPNENMTKINIIPEIHFTFSGSNLTIFCNKFYSIAELKFELSFILPLIDYLNISEEYYNSNNAHCKYP